MVYRRWSQASKIVAPDDKLAGGLVRSALRLVWECELARAALTMRSPRGSRVGAVPKPNPARQRPSRLSRRSSHRFSGATRTRPCAISASRETSLSVRHHLTVGPRRRTSIQSPLACGAAIGDRTPRDVYPGKHATSDRWHKYDRIWLPSVSRRGGEGGSRLAVWRVREVTCPKCRCRGVSRPRWSQSRLPSVLPGPSSLVCIASASSCR